MDPVSLLINESDTPAEWGEAAALVLIRISSGQADAGLIHHLMVKGWRVLDLMARERPFRAAQYGYWAVSMTEAMTRVLDEAVGQSTV